jgi:hypothetical protein
VHQGTQKKETSGEREEGSEKRDLEERKEEYREARREEDSARCLSLMTGGTAYSPTELFAQTCLESEKEEARRLQLKIIERKGPQIVPEALY